ncbi:MAG: TRAP transporter large permease subunit [Hyphomicrobiales bacterium]|nr:TRAP transporter large permease subunit [Hyphomicrobiales bacterium]
MSQVLLLKPLLLPALVTRGIPVDLVMDLIGTPSGNTPPVGVITYTVCGIIKCSFAEFVRWSWPFILSMAILLTLLALVPDLVLFLPNQLM